MMVSVSRHRTIMNIFEKEPRIHRDVFVAPSAAVIGDVEIGHGSSIWYGSILRGKTLGQYVFYIDVLLSCHDDSHKYCFSLINYVNSVSGEV